MREREKIEQVQRGEIGAGELCGSTTERMTIGLALNALAETNPGFGADEKGAWERLDASQRRIVRDFNREYRKKKWLTEEEIARAKMERELVDGSTGELMRWIKLSKGREASK